MEITTALLYCTGMICLTVVFKDITSVLLETAELDASVELAKLKKGDTNEEN